MAWMMVSQGRVLVMKWLVHPESAMAVWAGAGTKELTWLINCFFLKTLVPSECQLGLLCVDPPLVSAAFAYLLWPSFGFGHSQLLWRQRWPHVQQ